MSDLCFFEITNGFHKLRASVIKSLESLPQSTAWLKGATHKETRLVQNAIQAAVTIVNNCLIFDPEQRPDASIISEELTKICNELES
jgi:hypothetical protein